MLGGCCMLASAVRTILHQHRLTTTGTAPSRSVQNEAIELKRTVGLFIHSLLYNGKISTLKNGRVYRIVGISRDEISLDQFTDDLIFYDEFSLYEYFATAPIGLINGEEGCPCQFFLHVYHKCHQEQR